MKLKELKSIYRYNLEEKKFTIDVQLEDYRDAYSEWDFSPFTNRDLDDDLIEYILECSYEIPLRYFLVFDFHILNQAQDDAREERTIQGMQNFFKHETRKLDNYRMRVIRDIVSFFFVGCVLLFIGFYLSAFLGHSILFSIMSEGFFIGGWVMLWEMFSAWFFEMKKATIKKKHFLRLQVSELKFSYRI